jgi:hypothetical protein
MKLRNSSTFVVTIIRVLQIKKGGGGWTEKLLLSSSLSSMGVCEVTAKYQKPSTTWKKFILHSHRVQFWMWSFQQKIKSTLLFFWPKPPTPTPSNHTTTLSHSHSEDDTAHDTATHSHHTAITATTPLRAPTDFPFTYKNDTEQQRHFQYRYGSRKRLKKCSKRTKIKRFFV